MVRSIGVISEPADWETYRKRVIDFEKNSTGRRKSIAGAVSGVGSSPQAAAPLIRFLVNFFAAKQHELHSLVEASCGHWPSGWQPKINWPQPIAYTGVDLIAEQTDANARLVAQRGGATTFGLESARFLPMDMLRTPLPPADVLLTKDTLIHFTNAQISRFLNLSILTCPPRFRYVLFVHDDLSKYNASHPTPSYSCLLLPLASYLHFTSPFAWQVQRLRRAGPRAARAR